MNDAGRTDNIFDLETSSRPTTPTKDDCCGNACSPCVFDVHKQLLEQWKIRKVRGTEGIRRNNFLNPVSYKTFFLRDIVFIADNYVKILLYCRNEIDGDSKIILNPGQHVMLSVSRRKSRPYTPIFWSSDRLQLLVKIYPNGELSSYLANMNIGDEIRVRGPYGDFLYIKNRFREIITFSIGSGIAAIYPIARSIVDDETDETRLHLVAGFRTIAEIPLIKELQQLSDYWNVTCTLQISCPTSNEIKPNGLEIREGRLSEFTFNQLVENLATEQTLILICGTAEFNETLENWSRDRNFLHYHVFG